MIHAFCGVVSIGPSATRVWSTIMHENCFGGADDVCIEKRVFHRYVLIACLR